MLLQRMVEILADEAFSEEPVVDILPMYFEEVVSFILFLLSHFSTLTYTKCHIVNPPLFFISCVPILTPVLLTHYVPHVPVPCPHTPILHAPFFLSLSPYHC